MYLFWANAHCSSIVMVHSKDMYAVIYWSFIDENILWLLQVNAADYFFFLPFLSILIFLFYLLSLLHHYKDFREIFSLNFFDNTQ